MILIKPDDTVLLHDLEGYQPVAWLTRADTVRYDAKQGVLTAVQGDRWLRVAIEHATIDRRIAGSPAGEPISSCPDCASPLIETADGIACIGCDARYGLPDGATVLDQSCDCGLPLMAVERGDRFELCIDRECAPLETVVADRFDGAWDCPACSDGTLNVIRRGRLMVGCDQYPDCETAYQFPKGVVDGTCACGLPRFAYGDTATCLDSGCTHH